jgi:pyruvate/2-oxoacid:ferredoxin oxidoreductase beta subunit
MPEWLFKKENWFPRFIIIRREQGSGTGGDNSDEWYGFVKQMKRHLEHETTVLKKMLNRSNESTKKEIKTTQEEVKKVTAEMKTGQEEVRKVTAEIKTEMKTGQEEVRKDVAEVKIETAEMKV